MVVVITAAQYRAAEKEHYEACGAAARAALRACAAFTVWPDDVIDVLSAEAAVVHLSSHFLIAAQV